MKLFNRILSFALVLMMLFSMVAATIPVAAATPASSTGIEYSSNGGVYKIANDYVRFAYNSNTLLLRFLFLLLALLFLLLVMPAIYGFFFLFQLNWQHKILEDCKVNYSRGIW